MIAIVVSVQNSKRRDENLFRDMASALFSVLSLLNVNYSPLDALKENAESFSFMTIELRDMLKQEFSKDKSNKNMRAEKMKCSKTANRVCDAVDAMVKAKSREGFTYVYYNLLLYLDGMRSVGGFGSIDKKYVKVKR